MNLCDKHCSSCQEIDAGPHRTDLSHQFRICMQWSFGHSGYEGALLIITWYWSNAASKSIPGAHVLILVVTQVHRVSTHSRWALPQSPCWNFPVWRHSPVGMPLLDIQQMFRLCPHWNLPLVWVAISNFVLSWIIDDAFLPLLWYGSQKFRQGLCCDFPCICLWNLFRPVVFRSGRKMDPKAIKSLITRPQKRFTLLHWGKLKHWDFEFLFGSGWLLVRQSASSEYEFPSCHSDRIFSERRPPAPWLTITA